jgi:4,5-DOPA dioxygenase extradiol
MNTLSDLNQFTKSLSVHENLMPALFIGHGSPMNGIEDNEFSRRWAAMANQIPTPAAVIVISAHWLTKGTRITAMEFPKTIHDFGGFPDELYTVQYPAPGNPQLANETALLVQNEKVILDHDWGLDHGAWTVVKHMYPHANIPILQLSIDYNKDPKSHFDIAKQLMALRKKGVLIIGSGNMVHNLRLVAWDKLNENEYGYDWAIDMNEKFKSLIKNEEINSLIEYEKLGKEAQLSIPTPEHYIPLLYTLGVKNKKEEVSFFNDKVIGGSLTMTSLKVG